MTEADQKARLYTINQGVFATFLGGPLGGAILLAQNYRQFESPQSARRAIAIGILATFALVPLSMTLTERMPNFVVPLFYTIAFRLIAERLQGTELKSRIEAGAGRQSWWRTLGITVLALLCTALVVLGGVVGITTLFPSL